MVNEELRRGHDARPSASGSRGEWGLPPTTADVVNHLMVEAAPPEGDECRRAMSISPDDRG